MEGTLAVLLGCGFFGSLAVVQASMTRHMRIFGAMPMHILRNYSPFPGTEFFWTHFSFFFNVYALYASSCCQFILKCVERFLIYMYIFFFFFFLMLSILVVFIAGVVFQSCGELLKSLI